MQYGFKRTLKVFLQLIRNLSPRGRVGTDFQMVSNGVAKVPHIERLRRDKQDESRASIRMRMPLAWNVGRAKPD